VEIYTDLIFDLLKPKDMLSEVVQINEDQKHEFVMHGAREEKVSCLEQVL